MANDRMMQFFAFDHLPEHLQEVSRPFHATAAWVIQNLPENSERNFALRKLLEAKDCAVRARLYRAYPDVGVDLSGENSDKSVSWMSEPAPAQDVDGE
jgi:hypothetical protein